MGLKNFIWWLACRRYYSQAAYDRACGTFESVDLDSNEIDFSNRSALVVGIQESIIQATAIELAKRGCKLYLVSTDSSKGKDAFHAIKNSYPDNVNGTSLCRLYFYDFSNILQVKKFVNELKSDLKTSNDRFSLLLFQSESMQETWIDNPDSQVQPDFSVHVLSTYCIIYNLLESNLLESKQEYAKSRIIVIGNPALLRRSLLYYNLEGSNWKRSFKPERAYANYKREQMELITTLSSKYPDCSFYCVNPGLVDNPSLKYLAHSTFKSTRGKCRNTTQAADGVIWACTSSSVERIIASGNLILDRKSSSSYLPFCNTKPTSSQRKTFIRRLDEYKHKYYDEVPRRPTMGTVSSKSSMLVYPDSDTIYNHPELPTYSDTENKN